MEQKKGAKIIMQDGIDLEHLSEEDKRTLYMSMLARMLELYRRQREEVK